MLQTFHKKDPLLDEDFLRALSLEKQRVLYAKIIALDIDENSIEEITGKITQGSVPVDGKSLVRRTCSLTLVANELNIHDYLWGVETKIKLFIGLENHINTKYPDIVWMKMGTYVLTSFNISNSLSGFTVAIQGKDKMCLLNGDIGGTLTALTYDFGTMKVINKFGHESTEKIPIKQIITKAVHDFAKEPYHNIIINDLDDCGLELMEYRGEDPLYLIYSLQTEDITNITVYRQQTYYKDENAKDAVTIADLESDSLFIFKSLDDLSDIEIKPTIIYDNLSNQYQIIKITTGMTCGYRNTELVYAGDLTASVGEAITSVLSKIVSMLGDYEFFYNLDGQFVFQKKRVYIQTSWNNMVNNGEENWVENSAYTASNIFSFEDGTLITSYQNTPNIANLRNDFSVWGTRTTESGTAVPIHMRYAIDKKPEYYTTFDGMTTYTTKSKKEVEQDKKSYDLGIQEGYMKEESRFGLSEDWWEIRDWAKAWEYNGLPIPTDKLYKYCPIRANIKINPNGKTLNNAEEYIISEEQFEQWGMKSKDITTDDLVFNADGIFKAYHGGCTHTYSWWLSTLDPGGQYEGGYVYFYKPQVPVSAETGVSVQLKLASTIQYNCDWREIIYQMALDFNKNGDKDDFLSSIAKHNPYFYPTGYTGYESYYVDIEGFWRELYDPEYTASYDPISLTEEEYKVYCSCERPEPLYYDAPVVKQCLVTDPFYEGITYYTPATAGYKKADITSQLYYLNPSNYYYTTDFKVTIVPMSDTISSINTYYTRNADGYFEPVPYSTASSLLKTNLYKQETKTSFFPCITVKKYLAGKLYFTHENDTYIPQVKLAEDDYYNKPWLYYERIVKDGSVDFGRCLDAIAYNKERKYYTQWGEVYDSITFDSEEKYYEAIYKGSNIYYGSTVISYSSVYTNLLDYDENTTYYVKSDIQEYELDATSPYYHWRKGIFDAPETLNFWFDFLDSDSELSAYQCRIIGNRPKAVNDSNVKAIYFRGTPGIIFVPNLKDEIDRRSGYVYAQIPSYLEGLFTISGQSKSAKDVIDEYLYNYTYFANSITIQAIPVYHLEPNTRIFVRDDNSDINGEYIISKINYPLDINGTMTINASKVVDRIY